jgi:purine nucleoside permease
MFVQGQKPSLIIVPDQVFALSVALHRAGYAAHRGPRITREAEVLTYRKRFTVQGATRQNHIQVVCLNDAKDLGVFAHTEPWGYGLQHFLSAICDKANYGAGAAMLLRDLKRAGFSG